MGKRGRRRSGAGPGSGAGAGSGPGLGAGPGSGSGPESEVWEVPSAVYSDPDCGELELRGSLSPRSRSQYARVLAGGNHQDDAWQRATELLFEHLAIAWTLAGLRIERQSELLGRYRMASSAERQFVRTVLRQHLAENFPEMEAP